MIEFINKLFTIEELISTMWILIGVLSITQFAKISVKLFFKKCMNRGELFMFSFIGAIVLSFILWPSNTNVHWIIPGLAFGPIANTIYFGWAKVLKWKYPKLYDALNAKGKKDW